MISQNHDIQIERDEETECYFVVWAPLIASSGKTRREALEDLRVAAHFGVDTMVDLKLKDISKEKEA